MNLLHFAQGFVIGCIVVIAIGFAMLVGYLVAAIYHMAFGDDSSETDDHDGDEPHPFS